MTIASIESVVEEDMTILSRVVTLRRRVRRLSSLVHADARMCKQMRLRAAIEILPGPNRVASKFLQARSMSFAYGHNASGAISAVKLK
jgi:hypothetical protein